MKVQSFTVIVFRASSEVPSEEDSVPGRASLLNHNQNIEKQTRCAARVQEPLATWLTFLSLSSTPLTVFLYTSVGVNPTSPHSLQPKQHTLFTMLSRVALAALAVSTLASAQTGYGR